MGSIQLNTSPVDAPPAPRGPRVAVVTIATGNYVRFVPRWVWTARRWFAPEVDRRFFVMTDRRLWGLRGVTRLPTAAREWPLGTLLRFEMFWQHRAALAEFDSVFYIDADMAVAGHVATGEVLPDHLRPWLTAVLHPAFPGAGTGPFEDDPASLAYVTPDRRGTYYQGCFFGGDSASVLRMCDLLRGRVADDLSRGVIAKWWDESHMNWFFAQEPPTRPPFPPSFAFPEGWDLPYAPRIIHLKKDEARVRRLPASWAWGSVRSLFRLAGQGPG